MFDIGFSELLICLVIALLVIGPERLPETVRTIALWVGRLKRSLRDTRTEIERQIGADEIRRQLYNEEILHNIEKNRRALENSIQEIANELGPEAQERLKQRLYEHQELPDHSHMPDSSPSSDHSQAHDAPTNAQVNLPAPSAASPQAALNDQATPSDKTTP